MDAQVITTKTGAIHDLLGQHANYVDPSEQDSINLAVLNLLEQRNKTNKKDSLAFRSTMSGKLLQSLS